MIPHVQINKDTSISRFSAVHVDSAVFEVLLSSCALYSSSNLNRLY